VGVRPFFPWTRWLVILGLMAWNMLAGLWTKQKPRAVSYNDFLAEVRLGLTRWRASS
jgi:hypothetical protein